MLKYDSAIMQIFVRAAHANCASLALLKGRILEKASPEALSASILERAMDALLFDCADLFVRFEEMLRLSQA
jgi:hypothetical protein